MTPLDLSRSPPRSPREKLADLLVLPRTIDKARALLPGGRPGPYYITPGISIWLLRKLGFTEEEFIALVGSVHGENEIAAIVEERAVPERRARWNAFMEQLKIEGIAEDAKARAHEYGPVEADDLVFDVIEADDAKMFGHPR